MSIQIHVDEGLASLYDQILRERIKTWVNDNVSLEAAQELTDIDAEIDSSLTFSENINLLIKKFPTIWRSEEQEAPKQLVMPRFLIEKVMSLEKPCSFRPVALHGQYYLVNTRWPKTQTKFCLIEIVSVESIKDPQLLTEEDAKLTGCESRAQLFELFGKWYGKSKKYAPNGLGAFKYRNWFRVKEAAEL